MTAGTIILFSVAVSYPIAAAALWWLRWRGETVPHWWPAGWLLTGVIGLALLPFVGQTWAWWGVLLALGPWMLLSLIVDWKHKVWPMVVLDAAGLLAIGYGLYLVTT
jgi:hypothetical protein